MWSFSMRPVIKSADHGRGRGADGVFAYIEHRPPDPGGGDADEFSDNDKRSVFDIAIQTGAIFAVILVYWQKIRTTLVDLPTQRSAQLFALNVLIGFLPAVLLGLLFGKVIKAHLFTPVVVASTFIVGGFIILWAEARPGGTAVRVTDARRYDLTPHALKVGWCSAWP
jgi:undecaprenyl-diphosphatase